MLRDAKFKVSGLQVCTDDRVSNLGFLWGLSKSPRAGFAKIPAFQVLGPLGFVSGHVVGWFRIPPG